ncbi:hypothetical protein [Gracilibacillus xinjiangensis]|uniref:Uncharacterized protein n=1 Tax=Gracilibacillus xinjiangensis TaxID=1193282 RepID=A0ABV8WVC7_9BACI
MKQEWESFKRVKDCLLEGIYANQLSAQLVNKDITLVAMEPLLSIKKNNSAYQTYWKMDWTEDADGDDILLVKEQNTPEPIEYGDHFIMGSSFSLQNNWIKNVSGYGSKDGNIFSVLLALENLYILIEAGPVITISITEQEPNDLHDQIFTA